MQTLRRQPLRKQLQANGFTLMESLVAGVILFLLMLSTNRFLLMGMANSSRSGERAALEMAILNDIEHVQALDALVNNSDRLKPAACASNNAAQHLSQLINSQHPVPSNSDWSRQSDSSDPDILVLTYAFDIPMQKEASKEYRIVELNPSFMAAC